MSDHAFVSEALQVADAIMTEAKRQSALRGKPVTCCSGCSACCSEPVYVERAEVFYILESLTPEELEVVKVKVGRWLKHARRSRVLEIEETPVIPYLEAKLVCPFLRGNLCSVYERRPVSCRGHLAIGPRRYCEDTRLRLKQRYAIIKELSQFSIEALARYKRVMLFDHLGVHLAEILLGESVPESACKLLVEVETGEGT